VERRKAQGVWCHMAAPSLGQDDRGQKSEVGGQRSEGRRQKFYCGSGFPRPACPGRSPGEFACPELVEWVEGQPRLEQLLRL